MDDPVVGLLDTLSYQRWRAAGWESMSWQLAVGLGRVLDAGTLAEAQSQARLALGRLEIFGMPAATTTAWVAPLEMELQRRPAPGMVPGPIL